ncbi:MAG TPA: YiiX/YebB-like N1pC/P60 family cysteine hydrolase [Candidatus Eremiobacteraeota bacterium]|nr:YiiX/YebB-like N1pC/P60 family cysteine hydrolase [Candidatus Eremiobacteraeota bacterium]
MKTIEKTVITGTSPPRTLIKSSVKENYNDRFDSDKVGSDQNLKDLREDLKTFNTAKREIQGDVEIDDINFDGEVVIYGEMPTPAQLEVAFRKAAASESPGNSDDFEGVVKFKELMDSGKIIPGDIILISNPSKGEFHPISDLVPGNYSHVAVYLGQNDIGEHETIDAWANPRTPLRNAIWWPKSYNNWCVIRPSKADGSELSEEERNKVVDFARSTEGCKYNYMWAKNKVKLPVDKDKSKFYCSQLAWGAYKHTVGIDLDPNPGFHPKYAWGVAPQELHDSPHVKVVAEYYKPKSLDETGDIQSISE